MNSRRHVAKVTRALPALSVTLAALASVSSCGYDTTATPAGAGGPASVTVVRITATPTGCPPQPDRVSAGSVEFTATNLDAPTVSEIEVRTGDLAQVVGEKENLVEGLSGSFSASLQPGDYVVNCPGAAQPHWSLVVSPATSKAS